MTNSRCIDSPSQAGQFGWERIGQDEFAIPVIVRDNGTRYCPVRIVEQEIIKKYHTLPQQVFTCITLKSFYLTTCEAKLLNQINTTHCDDKYGNVFFTIKDVIISSSDIKELSRYLNISYAIFGKDLAQPSAKLGIINFTLDPHNPSSKSLVPYICKMYRGKPTRFVPMCMMDKYVVTTDSSVRASASDWDLMYLKMLCIYCGNGAEQDISRENLIILLDGLFYSNTNSPIVYEDYWQ